MDLRQYFYLNGLKHLGSMAAAVYMLQGNAKHALTMHQMVLIIIAIKWGTLIYSRFAAART